MFPLQALQEKTTHAKKGLTKILNKSRPKLQIAGEPAVAAVKPSAATKLRKVHSQPESALRELEAELVSLPTSTSTSTKGESSSLPSSQTIPRPVEESGEDDEELVSALEEDLEVNDSAPVAEAVVKPPEGVYDFDASVKDDPHQGTTYVVDTFNYYKNREVNTQATQELQISE